MKAIAFARRALGASLLWRLVRRPAALEGKQFMCVHRVHLSPLDRLLVLLGGVVVVEASSERPCCETPDGPCTGEVSARSWVEPRR